MPNDKVRTAFYADRKLLELSTAYLKKANCRSRNEFINQAMLHYIAFLQKDDDAAFLTPALETVMSGMIHDSENRIARVIYKLAVEISMLLHVYSSQSNITESELRTLRSFCEDEVKRLNGRFSFEGAVRYQRGE